MILACKVQKIKIQADKYGHQMKRKGCGGVTWAGTRTCSPTSRSLLTPAAPAGWR